MKLDHPTVNLLRLLDNESAPSVREASRTLFDLHLVQSLPGGFVGITKSGSRALFQIDCIAGLKAILKQPDATLSDDVVRWLQASGFIEKHDRAVTKRGKLWLESLDSMAQPTAPDVPMTDPEHAAQFCERRMHPAGPAWASPSWQP